MNKRKIIVISLIVLLIILLIGIKSCKNNESTNLDKNIQIEEQKKEIENSESDKMISEIIEDTELYTSTKGYELRYNSDKFQFKIEDGKEKFIFLEDENNIYFMVDVIESENIKEIKDDMIASAEVTGKYKITESDLSGIYTETKLENMKKQNIIFELNENKIVIIEINMYENDEESSKANLYIKNMIKTFKIK